MEDIANGIIWGAIYMGAVYVAWAMVFGAIVKTIDLLMRFEITRKALQTFLRVLRRACAP